MEGLSDTNGVSLSLFAVCPNGMWPSCMFGSVLLLVLLHSVYHVGYLL